jgi:nitroimidazol reductase NimA-like FMN-containing flavoprotein (pyridoxamine 5'-phosphate oxidase superfamily)
MIDMTTDQITDLLNSSLIGRLCMVDPDNQPYAIPMPFCWANGSIYLRVPLTGRKGRALSHCDRVCFEIDRYTQNLDSYASVLVEGRLLEVTDLAEKQHVCALNTVKYTRLRNGHRPGHGRHTPPEQVPLRRIAVARLSGRRSTGNISKYNCDTTFA